MTYAEGNHFNGEPWITKNDDMTSEKKNKLYYRQFIEGVQ